MDPLSFMAERPLGVVATVNADGTPHAVPVEVVVDDGHVYVWCRATSLKARNVARSGRVAVLVYRGNSFGLVRGAGELLDGTHPDYERITNAFLAKYDREESYGNDRLIKVIPERTVARGLD